MQSPQSPIDANPDINIQTPADNHSEVAHDLFPLIK